MRSDIHPKRLAKVASGFTNARLLTTTLKQTLTNRRPAAGTLPADAMYVLALSVSASTAEESNVPR
jgi:hypothetical protein